MRVDELREQLAAMPDYYDVVLQFLVEYDEGDWEHEAEPKAVEKSTGFVVIR